MLPEKVLRINNVLEGNAEKVSNSLSLWKILPEMGVYSKNFTKYMADDVLLVDKVEKNMLSRS